MYTFEKTPSGWLVYWGPRIERADASEEPEKSVSNAAKRAEVNPGESLAHASFALSLAR